MNQGAVRRAAVAGSFYPASRAVLLEQVTRCYLDPRGPGALPTVNEAGPRKIIGLVCPHAGFVYSGTAVAKAMAALAADGRPDVCVILGPNHGRGRWVDAIQVNGSWETPLGQSPVDGDVASAVALRCPYLQAGPAGFAGEHSLEVELPFLQHLFGFELPIVPIMLLDQSAERAQKLGEALKAALEGRNAVILASTDMTHFESAQSAWERDGVLVKRMLALDPEGLVRERERLDVSMCGSGPVAAMLHAARKLGATGARVLDYTNSGAVEPRPEVVAYLALEVTRG
jgi:MEMO1 family protein